MSDKHGDPSLRELIERVVNDEASADEIAGLEQQLLADPAARDRYLDYVNLHSALRRRFFTVEPAATDSQAGLFELGPFEPGPVQSGPVELGPNQSSPIGPAPAGPFPDVAADFSGRGAAAVCGWNARAIRFLASAAALAVIGIFAWLRFGASQAAHASPWIQEVKGEVTILSSDASSVARVGDSLRPGDRLRAGAEESHAVLAYADGTHVQVHGDSVVHAWANRDVLLQLLSGSMEVDAALQPAHQPLIFGTDHSRCLVLGTKFRLYRESNSTRLELNEGKVRLVRPNGGEAVDVQAGSVAIATNDSVPVEIQPLSPGRAQLEKTLPKAGQVVAFSGSAQGNLIITGHGDRGLKIWDADDFRLRASHAADAGPSDGLAMSPDGQTVVQLNRQGYLLLWRWAEGEARKTPLAGVNIRSRALSPDGLFVAQAHNGETELLSLDLAAGQVATVAQFKQPGKVGCLALSRGGRRLCAGYSGGVLRVYDTATQAIVCEQKLADTPTHMALAEDGLRVAVFTQRDGLKLIDLATGEQQPLWPPESERVRCMRFTPDGTRLLAGMNDHTARVWAVTDGRPLLVIDFDHSLSGIAWSEERQLLAVAGGAVKLWRCNFGAKMPEFGLKIQESFKPQAQ